MKLAVSSYSYYQYMYDGRMTLFDTVDKTAEIGFDGMEFIDLPKSPEQTQSDRITLAKELKQRCADHGLPVAAYTIGAKLWQTDETALRTEIDRVKSEVDIAAALGAPVMRHDLVWALDKTGPGRSFLGMIPKLAETVREITEYAASVGVKTCSENHGRIAQDSIRMEAFAAAVGHDNYGLLVDMGNFLGVDEDPVTAVSRLANFAFHVHAKDVLLLPFGTTGFSISRGLNSYHGTAIGDGNVPVKRCLGILKRAGYDGWVSLEYEGREDCVESIVKSYGRLRTYLEEL